MTSEKIILPQEDRPDEISILRMQLTISLKFHHSQTLEKLPREKAIQAIEEVWQSCHPEVAKKVSDTAICEDVPVTKGNTIYL